MKTKTGLKGNYDFRLQWDPDENASANSADNAGPASDHAEASIFTAIQEQLGLRLESRRDSVDVLVIDRIEHPTEN